ncbi:MAG: VOC family protein, partial [Proteobacteria bacterium]|nr:VOC family protein [Pseudomonadota bacterium]
MKEGAFIRITPFIHVPDIDAAIGFFEGVLGFTKYIHFGTYAYLEREKCGVRLLQNAGDEGAPPGNRRFAYYIDVE